MSSVNQKDILKPGLVAKGIEVVTQKAVSPTAYNPTGDKVGVRNVYVTATGTLTDPLYGEDRAIALEELNGKLIAETAWDERIYFPTYVVTEKYETAAGDEVEDPTSTTLRVQPPALYSKEHPTVALYTYKSYKVGSAAAVTGKDPKDITITGDVTVTFIYELT